jgi:hypothetical protein
MLSELIGNKFLKLPVNYVELFLTGTAGNSLNTHNGMKFSTQDVDNDISTENCAVEKNGAWWFRRCSRSHLNGEYLGGHHEHLRKGVFWVSYKGTNYSYEIAEMKVGPNRN